MKTKLLFFSLLMLALGGSLSAQDLRPSAYVGKPKTVTVRGSKIQGSTGGVTTIAQQDITPTVNATTYIYVDLSGTPVIGTSTSGFPTSNYFPICTVITDINGIITSFTDNRPDAFMAAGGGGGAVSSVFTRTGAVVATANDYSVAQLSGLPVTAAQGGTGVASPTAHADPQAEGASVFNFIGGSALTGQVKTATNGADPSYKSPGLPGTDVNSASYPVQCDSATATIDRATTLRFITTTPTVTVPDPTASGCGSNFSFVMVASGVTATVNRTTTAVFNIYGRSGDPTLAATTFNLTTGQYATVSSPDNTNWLVRIVPAAAAGGGAIATVSQLSQTAAVTTFTLCAAATCGNGSNHQYRIDYNVWGSGTACSNVTAGAIAIQFTWTDENAVTHSAVGSPLWDTAASSWSSNFSFKTSLATESAHGSQLISTNGTIIQSNINYASCTTGTGTYNVRYAVFQLQ